MFGRFWQIWSLGFGWAACNYLESLYCLLRLWMYNAISSTLKKKLYSSTNQFKAYYVALWADKEYSKNLKSLISPSRNRIHRWPPCQGSSPGSSRPHWLLTSLCSNLLCMGYARAHCLQVQQKVNPPIQYYQSCPFHRMKSQSHMDFNHSVKQSVGF